VKADGTGLKAAESLRGRQLFQGIGEGDAQWLEMALIGRQNGQFVRGGSGGNGNVLEAGIMGTRGRESGRRDVLLRYRTAGCVRHRNARRRQASGAASPPWSLRRV
jgi:hypothetical protein